MVKKLYMIWVAHLGDIRVFLQYANEVWCHRRYLIFFYIASRSKHQILEDNKFAIAIWVRQWWFIHDVLLLQNVLVYLIMPPMTSHLLAYWKKNPDISKMSHSNHVKLSNHLFIHSIYCQYWKYRVMGYRHFNSFW